MSDKRQPDDTTPVPQTPVLQREDTAPVLQRDDTAPVLRLDPEKRLCPEYDAVTIKRYRAAAPGKMGFRVLDNFCEEHIQ
ncbi:MAG: hypothetical protein IJQ81_07365 [Oscillibacter sp.]|nr:hypothetical protein [Oscillibacter sp.]